MSRPSLFDLENHSDFIQRHIGPTAKQQTEMAQTMGYEDLDALIDDTVPAAIRRDQPMDLPDAQTEQAVIIHLRELAQLNVINKSYIGTGYNDTYTPAVIQRNVLENPGWYTAYTPYQPEISQGRLEALLTFQQMTLDLTGMELANASMLDEGTAAAEAMTLLHRVNKKNRSNVFLVADDCHPQTIAVVKTRAKVLDIEVVVGKPEELTGNTEAFGLLLQYPGTYGHLEDISPRVLAAPTPPTSPPATPTSAPHPAALSACQSTAAATRHCVWPCKPGSSTSAGRRPPATSAPPRPCWPLWPPFMPCITAPLGCAASPPASSA
jgi:glycine dehydrogenase